MNNKIFNLIEKNLLDAFNSAEQKEIYDSIGIDTRVSELPWATGQFETFKSAVEAELELSSDYAGTVKEIVDDFSLRYMDRFYGEVWQNSINQFNFTGMTLADTVNALNPTNVLDVGCGFNPFKGIINNLIGIDKHNTHGDVKIDIIDYNPGAANFDVILALGSINYDGKEEVEKRFAHCVNLLATNGKFFLRLNPGKDRTDGPYIDFFPWDRSVVDEFAAKYNLTLNTFEIDNFERYFVVYTKL